MDWLVAAILAKRAGCLPHIKFIMKQELHWVPLVGYYLKILGHIYVRRKGFNPQRLIERVEEYKKAGTPVSQCQQALQETSQLKEKLGKSFVK